MPDNVFSETCWKLSLLLALNGLWVNSRLQKVDPRVVESALPRYVPGLLTVRLARGLQQACSFCH